MSINDKELYKQKFQAQLDGWKADVDKLKARAQVAKADAQLDLNKLVDDLDSKLKLANGKLSELSEAGESAWESVKKNVESAWDSLKASIHDATAKFKE